MILQCLVMSETWSMIWFVICFWSSQLAELDIPMVYKWRCNWVAELLSGQFHQLSDVIMNNEL